MRHQLLIGGLVTVVCSARAPQTPFQIVSELSPSIWDRLVDQVSDWSTGAEKLWKDVSNMLPDTLEKLSWKEPKKEFERIVHGWDQTVNLASLPDHRLRIKSPNKLGVDNVTQYSGYLDVEDKKHFFFWFFESRNDPKNDPVVLWLNGGPGCSSLTGLFMELGPSSIGKDGKPKYNANSWNQNASVIFLDQPVNVGYSYSSESVTDTVAAGKDVYALIKLFFKAFPEYEHLDFHIAGESYAGHYIPVFADELVSHPKSNINLKSILIGNGLTDAYTQYAYYQPMACGFGGHKAVVSPAECQSMESALPRCQSLIKACYNSGSVWSCVPASLYCNNAMMGPYQKTGMNVYDIRKTCEDTSNLCYPILSWVSTYLNRKDVMQALGAEVEQYESCNFDINRNFLFHGDWMKPYHLHIASLLKKGIATLIYAGDKDFICNWLGNRAWTEELEWSGKKGFNGEETRKFVVDGTHAGDVKSSGNFTFMRVFDAGHMVPFDQPAASLAMFNRWVVDGDYAYRG